MQRSRARCELAAAFNVDAVLCAEDEDVPARVRELTGGQGADRVIVAAPDRAAQEQSPALAAKGGVVQLTRTAAIEYAARGIRVVANAGGVNPLACRDALQAVVSAARSPEADPLAVTCAVDWLLYDWLMAHREDPDSAEIVFPKGHEADAALIVSAAAASVISRATFDPGLVGLIT